ncbi:MAG: protein-L-isoaspartate(D-aspartate) O-methyltransferase [Rhodospirillaceae bacterium]|jgi:protein-L-isoaspartate(D-aspartate) O-methyltransferase|nr:protein-L-isoaspartate(D-aspartate) O-methyltransferase [Rhodospirillaceae bacterium]MBT5666087.1 protein-L-isoaspartate(D-aspartate) O-methyltransferase [Rhodospirillaceae bacterium]MBT5810487.1 protein-L-isoaspartate(D-aspartate) O-methyltransferase [Rhodospirillaceae bacterium]
MTDAYAKSRDRLIAQIERDVRDTRNFLGKDQLDPRVIEALRRTPRHEFVEDARQRADAYENRPLPIGHGQTISQPYIVAIMTDMLQLTPESTVLEIGTGCGYQTAILAQLAARVYSVEIVAALAKSAKARLARLGYRNVRVMQGDGRMGWAPEAPYDAIIATAAARETPVGLRDQVRPGGRMVIPLGAPHMAQSLVRLDKDEDGHWSEHCHLPVAFVPMTAS